MILGCSMVGTIWICKQIIYYNVFFIGNHRHYWIQPRINTQIIANNFLVQRLIAKSESCPKQGHRSINGQIHHTQTHITCFIRFLSGVYAARDLPSRIPWMNMIVDCIVSQSWVWCSFVRRRQANLVGAKSVLLMCPVPVVTIRRISIDWVVFSHKYRLFWKNGGLNETW